MLLPPYQDHLIKYILKGQSHKSGDFVLKGQSHKSGHFVLKIHEKYTHTAQLWRWKREQPCSAISICWSSESCPKTTLSIYSVAQWRTSVAQWRTIVAQWRTSEIQLYCMWRTGTTQWANNVSYACLPLPKNLYYNSVSLYKSRFRSYIRWWHNTNNNYSRIT